MNFQDISNIKNKIFSMVKKREISDTNLELLFHNTLGDMEQFVRKNNSENNKILLQIYLNPYLLCDDRLLEDNNNFLNLELLSNLLVKRYNEELQEYETRYKDGETNKVELNNNILCLKNLYFTSTKIGKKIYNKYSDEILKLDNGNIFLQNKGNILLKKKKNHDKI